MQFWNISKTFKKSLYMLIVSSLIIPQNGRLVLIFRWFTSVTFTKKRRAQIWNDTCSWLLYQNTHEFLLCVCVSNRSWTMTFCRMCFPKQQLHHHQKAKGGVKMKQCESELAPFIQNCNQRKIQYCCSIHCKYCGLCGFFFFFGGVN